MSNFNVDILTPSQIIGKDLEAESLIVPTEKGTIEIMKDHTHIIEKLTNGILIVKNGSSESKYFVSGGICKLLANKLHIMTNICEPAEAIDKDRAKKSLENAKKRVSSSESISEDELNKYTQKIAKAKLRLTIG